MNIQEHEEFKAQIWFGWTCDSYSEAIENYKYCVNNIKGSKNKAPIQYSLEGFICIQKYINVDREIQACVDALSQIDDSSSPSDVSIIIQNTFSEIFEGTYLRQELVNHKKYKAAYNMMIRASSSREMERALSAFEEIKRYRDADNKIVLCQNE